MALVNSVCLVRQTALDFPLRLSSPNRMLSWLPWGPAEGFGAAPATRKKLPSEWRGRRGW